ncbi:MAG: tRNA uridine-5-carboxymethylaminomethyl(34) synthesis GTPase MnmE [Gammaproteobacteria bacterium]|nr:tRNA uridine-5-carboxymethylaminomethyl(34) synthesis GTPase MnmE [Gammaproteobacteria bacterium]
MNPDDRVDTIAAIATPAGRGGVGVVRVSGPLTQRIASAVLGRVPEPRRAEYRVFRAEEGEAIDTGLALFFPRPHSFTGEDVLELHGHGGPVVLDRLLRRLLALGARPARPGEFSERAFLNDKIDLAQAEAIADLIDSASEQAARAAMRSLEGEFSARVRALVEDLTALRVYVEAAIDFPEEEVDFLADAELRRRFLELKEGLDAVTRAARQGCLLREGIRVVIAGRPNAGKSSLLNRLAERETAIVSEIPGTTRDVLREYIAIDGLPLHVIDTAGLRDSEDPVERIGIHRAWSEIETADRVLLVSDSTRPDPDEDLALLKDRPQLRARLTRIHNKIDLGGPPPALNVFDDGRAEVFLSAATGAGLDLLRTHLKACMGYQSAGEGVFSARRRHLDALARADRSLTEALRQLTEARAGELAAEELRLAQQSLGEITGEVTSDDLLGRIFASFCIGK